MTTTRWSPSGLLARWCGVCLLALSAVVGVVAAPGLRPETAEASPSARAVVSNQPNVTSYNVCFLASCGGTGFQKADEFAAEVFNRASPKPLQSGFQELCQGSSYARLDFWFTFVHGYLGSFESTGAGCGGSGPNTGLAIFWQGGCHGGSFPSHVLSRRATRTQSMTVIFGSSSAPRQPSLPTPAAPRICRLR